MHMCMFAHPATQTHSRLHINVGIHTHEATLSHPPVSTGSRSHIGILFLCLSMSPVLRRFKLRTKKHLRMFAASFHLLYMNREGLNTPHMGKKSVFPV